MNTPSPDPRDERETRPEALVQLVVREAEALDGAFVAGVAEERAIMSRIHDYSGRYLELGWQPIETAPADGRRILVFDPGMREPVDIRGADGDFWRHEKVGPKAWMPLPAFHPH